MTVTYQSLIVAFPEFTNTAVYPQATVEFWISQAYLQINPCTYGTSTDLAVMLFTAHNIVLAAQRSKATAGGAIAGSSSGIVASKSVADVSVSYDTNLTAIEGAGPWNATTYGQQFYQMAKSYASGPYYRPGPRRAGRYRF